MITHYDLFAGIGGFSLAIDEVFNDRPVKHIFCEWERFPTSVLKQHWPGAEYWGDIAGLVAHTNSKGVEKGRNIEEQARLARSSDNFTIVTGGFPCQPFSQAGRRRGTSDDRYQWPNMFAVIQNTKPEWVVAENVRGLVTWNDGLVLETVCADLEAQGYEVQPFIIPAVAVGAPHRRDRVWIIAHSERDGQSSGQESRSVDATAYQQSAGTEDTINPAGVNSIRSNDGRGGQRWGQSWQEVAFATCNDAMDDGLPRIVDGVPQSFSSWRRESIKAYGNAIVPQVAIEIMRSIREAQES